LRVRLLELDGRDLRREPIEKRKALLAKLLKREHCDQVLGRGQRTGASRSRAHPPSRRVGPANRAL
jgi:ATP-dependent DNA ligase